MTQTEPGGVTTPAKGTVMGRIISQRGQARPSPDAGARREPDPTAVQVLPVLRGLNGLVGDYEPVLGVAVWIALRRAHEGGVANLAGQWLNSGRRVPEYVADALDGLTSAGLLALGEADPQSCGVQRVTVTDTGSAQYVALCQIHNPGERAAVRTPRRWARSPYDQHSHLLAERSPDQIGVLVAVCGRRMSWSVDASAQPTGRRCLTCEALASDTHRLPVRRAQPHPGLRQGSPGADQIGWAHCPPDRRLHLLTPAEAVAAATGSHVANDDRGGNAANNELIAELLRRIRVQQTSHEGRC